MKAKKKCKRAQAIQKWKQEQHWKRFLAVGSGMPISYILYLPIKTLFSKGPSKTGKGKFHGSRDAATTTDGYQISKHILLQLDQWTSILRTVYALHLPSEDASSCYALLQPKLADREFRSIGRSQGAHSKILLKCFMYCFMYQLCPTSKY